MEALETEPDAFGSSAEEHCATSVADAALRLGSDPANNFVVGAFVEGELVGTAGFYRPKGLKKRHKGHILGFYVTPSTRGNSIARFIMSVVPHRPPLVECIHPTALSLPPTPTPSPPPP